MSKSGDEEPGSKGQHRRRTAGRGAVLVSRRERRHALKTGIPDDNVDRPEGGTLSNFMVSSSNIGGARSSVDSRVLSFPTDRPLAANPPPPSIGHAKWPGYGPLGKFPIPTGKLPQLTRIFHGALLSGAEVDPGLRTDRSKCVVCSGVTGSVRLRLFPPLKSSITRGSRSPLRAITCIPGRNGHGSALVFDFS